MKVRDNGAMQLASGSAQSDMRCSMFVIVAGELNLAAQPCWLP